MDNVCSLFSRMRLQQHCHVSVAQSAPSSPLSHGVLHARHPELHIAGQWSRSWPRAERSLYQGARRKPFILPSLFANAMIDNTDRIIAANREGQELADFSLGYRQPARMACWTGEEMDCGESTRAKDCKGDGRRYAICDVRELHLWRIRL